MDPQQRDKKIFLNVKYEQKDNAKKLGCKWDNNIKLWYIGGEEYWGWCNDLYDKKIKKILQIFTINHNGNKLYNSFIQTQHQKQSDIYGQYNSQNSQFSTNIQCDKCKNKLFFIENIQVKNIQKQQKCRSYNFCDCQLCKQINYNQLIFLQYEIQDDSLYYCPYCDVNQEILQYKNSEIHKQKLQNPKITEQLQQQHKKLFYQLNEKNIIKQQCDKCKQNLFYNQQLMCYNYDNGCDCDKMWGHRSRCHQEHFIFQMNTYNYCYHCKQKQYLPNKNILLAEYQFDDNGDFSQYYKKCDKCSQAIQFQGQQTAFLFHNKKIYCICYQLDELQKEFGNIKIQRNENKIKINYNCVFCQQTWKMDNEKTNPDTTITKCTYTCKPKYMNLPGGGTQHIYYIYMKDIIQQSLQSNEKQLCKECSKSQQNDSIKYDYNKVKYLWYENEWKFLCQKCQSEVWYMKEPDIKQCQNCKVNNTQFIKYCYNNGWFVDKIYQIVNERHGWVNASGKQYIDYICQCQKHRQ